MIKLLITIVTLFSIANAKDCTKKREGEVKLTYAANSNTKNKSLYVKL